MYADKITKIANALTNQNFGGTCSIDNIPQHVNENNSIIINTHSSNLPGRTPDRSLSKGTMLPPF